MSRSVWRKGSADRSARRSSRRNGRQGEGTRAASGSPEEQYGGEADASPPDAGLNGVPDETAAAHGSGWQEERDDAHAGAQAAEAYGELSFYDWGAVADGHGDPYGVISGGTGPGGDATQGPAGVADGPHENPEAVGEASTDEIGSEPERTQAVVWRSLQVAGGHEAPTEDETGADVTEPAEPTETEPEEPTEDPEPAQDATEPAEPTETEPAEPTATEPGEPTEDPEPAQDATEPGEPTADETGADGTERPKKKRSGRAEERSVQQMLFDPSELRQSRKERRKDPLRPRLSVAPVIIRVIALAALLSGAATAALAFTGMSPFDLPAAAGLAVPTLVILTAAATAAAGSAIAAAAAGRGHAPTFLTAAILATLAALVAAAPAALPMLVALVAARARRAQEWLI